MRADWGRNYAPLAMNGPALKIGLNLLGLPTLRQGGAGLLAGMEAEELSRRRPVELRVLAGKEVAAELGDGEAVVLGASGGQGSSPLRRLGRIADLRDPMRYMAETAPSGAFDGFDVVHYPLSFMAAPEYDGATVVTCVDLQHLHHPRFFSRRDRLLRALRWHRSVRRATRVAVFSEFVRGSVEERLGVPGERIDVVGACCSPRFFEAAAASPPPGNFVFYPASPLPAKNHGLLLEAFARIGDAARGLKLILVGPLTHDWSPVRRRIADLGLGESVEIRGHVSLDELVGLYRSARAMIFPSLFEGFGIPVLEAMAAGCPVAAANATSIPEVCGDSAILFDPDHPEAIAEGIRRVVEMPEGDRSKLIDRARERAQRFSGEAMVDLQLRSFTRAAGTIRR